MANFTVSWIVGSGVYRQDLYLKPKYSGTYQMIASVAGIVNSYTVQGLQDNIIYLFKIVAYCDADTPSDGTPYELINFTCPTLTLTPGCNGVINYSFPHSGGDVNQYNVILYDNGGTLITTDTKSVTSTVTGSFSSLALNTPYKVRVVPKADTKSKTTCAQETATTLAGAPILVSSPSSIVRCDGGANTVTTLTASFSGSGITYSWYRNGTLISNGGSYSGATTNSLSIQNAATVLGSFVCRATNACGFVESTAAVITAMTGTPTLLTLPSLIPVCVTGSVTLSVTAAGDVTYQWQISTNGGSTYSNISGATSSTYVIAAGTIVAGNKYRVLVNSSCTSQLTSTAATVDSAGAPSITTQPTSIQVCPGSNGTFTVAYSGLNISSTVWQRDINGTWTDLSTTGTSLTTSTVGSYRYKVTNDCTTVYSNTVTLSNYTNVAYSALANEDTVCVGVNKTFTNTVTGSVLSQQWELSTNGGTTWSLISGATTNSYTVSSAQYTQNGYKYRHTVTGQCNTITNISTLNVYQPASITAQPQNTTACVGTNYQFSATVTFGGTIAYQWQESSNGTTWTDITGATGTSVTRSANAVGVIYHRLKITHCGNVTYSNSVTVTISTVPSITAQPVNTQVCSSQNAVFQATVTGATTLQWQIFLGGIWSDISGQTTATLTLTAVTLSMNNNQYRIAATNTCGTVYSSIATLIVNDSTPNWVNRNITTYFVCVGVDKYYQQIDTNGCSATYNQTRTGSLFQANSTDCGYVPPCNPPTITVASLQASATSQCLEGLIIEAIYLDDFSDPALLPSTYTHPCPTTITQHYCNRAFFEIFGNNIYLGDARLNNAQGTGGTVTQSGGLICTDYGNTPAPLTGGIWTGSAASRYSKITLTQSQAIAVANAGSGSNITFSLVGALSTYNANCGGNTTAHTNVTWIRISRPNGQVLYNGCPSGNITTIDVCINP